jgi:transglutaminase-like putative cysteine protease
MITAAAVDPKQVDWALVGQSSYLVQHRVSYEYPAPIDDLHHHLVVFAPREHGDQRRLSYQLELSTSDHRMATRTDAFGNLVVDLSVPRVESSIEFDASMVVQRQAGAGPHRVRAAWLRDRRMTGPSPLTSPDAVLTEVAATLTGADDPLELAARLCTWVNRAMSFERGATTVGTTAAQALALGRGVCQDYAHVMIALCRLCGIPARYVSGHLLGEGPMHAWVEVLLPSPDDPAVAVAWPFDPTHDRVVGLRYVTVAVGRDYSDVSPTRGTFRAAAGGRLSSQESVSLASVQYSLLGYCSASA